MVEVSWDGSWEIAQTHVVKAVGETRRAPRVIAQREAEFLFTPADSRKLRPIDTSSDATTSSSQRIESIGKAYLLDENGVPVNSQLIDSLVDGTDSLFDLDLADVGIIIDLKHLRLVEAVSVVFEATVSLQSAQVGFRYDDGQEQIGAFQYPNTGWLWHDLLSSANNDDKTLTLSIPKTKARYISLKLKREQLQHSRWSLRRVEIVGGLDGLAARVEQTVLSKTRNIDPRASTSARVYVPSHTSSVRIAVYSKSGRLLGSIDARDPSDQRAVFENQVSDTIIEPYSDSAWSATLPYDWVEEGNTVMIGCINESRPNEALVHRLELKNLAQFSEHTITRTKMVIFGTDEDILRLNPTTFDGRKLARNLKTVMPVAELKWADTDLWHLPYLVVIGKDGAPALVTSEEERRAVTDIGTEIQWEVMKNFLSKWLQT